MLIQQATSLNKVMLTRRVVLSAVLAASAGALAPQKRQRSDLFAQMWRNHPMGDARGEGVRWPCANLLDIRTLSDPANITTDQCAIRLGIAIARTFPDIRYRDLPKLAEPSGAAKGLLVCRDLTHAECAHSEDDLHILRTGELASCLMIIGETGSFSQFNWLRPPEPFDRPEAGPSKFRDALAGRNGILLIENFWDCRNGIFHGSHIDLWHGGVSRTKNELYYRGRWSPDSRYDTIADRIVFWEVVG